MEIPLDLVENILSRLSTRDLLRLKCVSKEWCAIIKNPLFMQKHYLVQYSISKADGNMPYFGTTSKKLQSCLLYLHGRGRGQIITLDMTCDLERDSKAALDVYSPTIPYQTRLKRYNIALPSRFVYLNDYDVDCRGCVNGIICLVWGNRVHSYIRDSFLALWNPAIRDFKMVEYPKVPVLFHRSHIRIDGFGFDPLHSDYKILGSYWISTATTWANYIDDDTVTYHQLLYSLENNSWKQITYPPTFLPHTHTDACFNGVFYWTTDVEKQCVILSFNFSTEVFKVSDQPNNFASLVSNYDMLSPGRTLITLYKESVALVVYHEVKERASSSYNIDIWVVTLFDDAGIPLLWQHLPTITPKFIIPRIILISILTTGDLYLIEVSDADDRITGYTKYLYDLSSGEYTKLGMQLRYGVCYRYVGSLFPLSKKIG